MRAWRALDIRGEFGGWRIGLDCGEGWFISVVVLSYLIYVHVYIHVYHQLLIILHTNGFSENQKHAAQERSFPIPEQRHSLYFLPSPSTHSNTYTPFVILE